MAQILTAGTQAPDFSLHVTLMARDLFQKAIVESGGSRDSVLTAPDE